MADAGFSERFKHAVRLAGGPSVVHQMLGKSLKTLARYTSGETEPGFMEASKVCHAAGVSLEWLFGGNVSISTEDPLPISANDDEIVHIPMLDVVASAGIGLISSESSVISRLPFPRALLRQLGVRVENAHFTHCAGDSMWPTIADGAVVLVDVSKRKSMEDGIYNIVFGEAVRIKRLQFGVNSLMLISDNAEKYPREIVSGADLDAIKIVGKVFWSGGAL